MNKEQMKNNWYVITGSSCCGKTRLVRELEKKGYDVVQEVARTYIDEWIARGETIEEIRKDEVLFQENVLKRKIEIESALPKERTVFFDRGIPDTYAYDKLCGVTENPLLESASKHCFYKKVFLLAQLPFKADYARIETPEQQNQLHGWLEEGYRMLGFPIVNVPVLSLEERVEFILNSIQSDD